MEAREIEGSAILACASGSLAARAALAAGEGVLDVRTVRLRWIGHTLHAEADLVVPDGASLHAGHDIAHRAEARLLAALPRLSTATIHISPDGAHS